MTEQRYFVLALLILWGCQVHASVSGIYFCTRDLEQLSSKNNQEKTEAIKKNDKGCTALEQAYANNLDMAANYVFVSYKDQEGDECHYIWRHCFLVQAESLGEIVFEGKRLLSLKHMGSLGFGGTGERVRTQNSKSEYSERAEMSPEPMFLNNEYKNATISCQLAYSEADVKESEIEQFKVSSHGIVWNKWAVVEEAIYQETLKGYDPFSHNCCSVAVAALKKINPNIEELIPLDEINFGLGLKNTGYSGVAFVASKKIIAGLSKRSKHREDFYDDL